MTKYKVSLRRTYLVEVEAADADRALEAVEWFVGDPAPHYNSMETEGVGRINIKTMVENEAILEDL